MGCKCEDCVASRNEREALRHGGEDWETDEEVLVPYRKKRRKTMQGKRKRACAKSKTGEECSFTVPKKLSYGTVYCCERCGKHGPINWNWQF